MTDETADILATDLAPTSMALPLLPKDDYVLQVKKVETVTNPDKGTKIVKITLSTTEEAKATNGERVKPGFPIFDNISLVPTNEYSPDQIKRRLKQFRVAVLGTAGKEGQFLPTEQYEGKNVRATVKIQDARDGYDARNQIAKYVMA